MGLTNCRETCYDFKYWVDKRTSLWSRKLGHGLTPMHRAVRNGDLEMCRLIVDNLQDKNPVDTMGWTALHRAVQNGHFEICRLIIENVKDKNPRGPLQGDTPMHWAVKLGRYDIFRLLFDNAQDKNPSNMHGITPMHWAAMNGQ